MSSRNERRRRAAVRRQETADSHNGRMMAMVVKSHESRQIKGRGDIFGDLYDADKAIRPPVNLDSLMQLAEANAIHSACIEAKVSDSVGRGWELRADGDDDVDEKAKAQAEAVLADQLKALFTPEMPFDLSCRQAIREMEQTGWGVWEIAREGEEIAAVYPLPAQTLRATSDDDVFVQVKGDKKVFYKRYGAEGNVSAKHGHRDQGDDARAVEDNDVANEVLIFKHYSARNAWYGMPPWISGIPAIAEMTAIREFNVSWFQSGGQTDRSVHVKAGDAGTAEVIARSIKQQMEDGRGTGHTTVVTWGSEDTAVSVESMSPEQGKRDGQFRGRWNDLAKEVVISHQVPPYRIGWAELGSLGGSAAKEMLTSYRFGTVEPLQTIAEGVLNATLFNPENGGLSVGEGWTFEFTDLDWSAEELELQRAEAARELGVANGHEVRDMLGMDPSDDPSLDLYLYKGQVVGDAAAVATGTDVLAQLRDAIHATLTATGSGPAQDPTTEDAGDLPTGETGGASGDGSA